MLYKIATNVLENRLKSILPNAISEFQSASVPGRNITDNMLVAFEVLRYMKRKNSGSKGEVAFDLDFKIAYDRADWSYLKNIMQRMEFSNKWI